MNPKASSRPDDSPSPTENGVNDGLSSSSSNSNRSNRNHEVDNGDNWGDEALVDEVGAFESSSLGGAFASPTSFVAFFTGFVAARARELKELNVNVII